MWQDVKGIMVLAGTYEEAVKMMGDMAFLQTLMNFPKEVHALDFFCGGGWDDWLLLGGGVGRGTDEMCMGWVGGDGGRCWRGFGQCPGVVCSRVGLDGGAVVGGAAMGAGEKPRRRHWARAAVGWTTWCRADHVY